MAEEVVLRVVVEEDGVVVVFWCGLRFWVHGCDGVFRLLLLLWGWGG